MESIVRVLPPNVANQIAAGEVVNRPASALKELLDNAIDASSTEISVSIQDAGKTLIRVQDNGCGMCREDAKNCFLAHATSKIRTTEDLSSLHTMGFRGEALASIAAVAQVELQTKRENEPLGVQIRIEGGEIKEEREVNCAKGCSMSVKNLYFNTPARREFLKSSEIEFKYIEEEFKRQAIMHPEIKFSLKKDGKTIYDLGKSTQKQRILHIFGGVFDRRLHYVKDGIDGIEIEGFIATPEYYTKSRDKQFVYVNSRFVKHYGIQKAVESAYARLLPEKNYPSYFLFIKLDPSQIDVNIHPNKTEIRFEDESLIFSLVQSMVKHKIGLSHLSSEIDFEPSPLALSGAFGGVGGGAFSPNSEHFQIVREQSALGVGGGNSFHSQPIRISDIKNPFFDVDFEDETSLKNSDFMLVSSRLNQNLFNEEELDATLEEKEISCIQISREYLASVLSQKLLLIDIAAAIERINYDRNKNKKIENIASQRLLFPQRVELSVSQSQILQEMLQTDFAQLWDMEKESENIYLIRSVPSSLEEENLQRLMEDIVDIYMQLMLSSEYSQEEMLRISLAKPSPYRHKILKAEEMQSIVENLFASAQPHFSPSGKKIFVSLSSEDIKKCFR